MQNKLPLLLFFLTTIICVPTNSFAQFSKSWSAWEVLHEDADIKVELSIYRPKENSCTNGNKQFKFKYRVTGRYKGNRTFLNWKISYIDCNGKRYYQQNSIPLWKSTFEDISRGSTLPTDKDKWFTAKRIDKPFFEVKVANVKQEGSGLMPSLKSEPPKKIIGVNEIFLGETLELSVEGGLLGEGAEWVWYIGECGKRLIGRGESIKLDIPKRTTIFVRAEGKNNTTLCVKKTITVDFNSSAPKAITGRTNICYGEQTTLGVIGGSLGLAAQWVWYTDKCGTNKVGTGMNINVRPKKDTYYFVRAEGQLNTTNCASILVTVDTPVDRPEKIQVLGKSSICQGESLTLAVKDNSNNDQFHWYQDSCGGTFIGVGSSMSVSPSQTTTYFVRAEGVCNKTICLSKKIIVTNSSVLPSSIAINERGKHKRLSISRDAQLAAGAHWQWYRGNCGARNSAGKGTMIKVKDRRTTTTYHVRAEGKCTNDFCQSIILPGLKNKKKQFQHFNHLHFGLAAGIEYNIIKDIELYSSYPIDQLNGVGLRTEVSFHPLIKDFMSIGVLGAASVGLSPYVFDGGEVPNSDPTHTDQYFYTHFSIGGEVALGVPFIKILAKVNKEFQRNKLDRKTGNATINFDETLHRDYLGAGIRLGAYRSTRNLDILYLYYRNNQSDFLDFDNTFSALDNRASGLQISWQVYNKYTLQTNIYWPNNQNTVLSSDTNNVSFYSSVLINLDRFY